MDRRFDERQREFWNENQNLRRFDHPVVQAFAEQRVACIADLFGGWTPASALDVGCGDGFGMQYMSRLVRGIHGCDQSPKMLDANPVDAAFLKLCDAYALEYGDDAFDLVYCWELLHHIGEPQRVVSEMARVSARSVLLCEPNCLNPAMAAFGVVAGTERGVLRFTPSYTARLLEHAGLERVEHITVGWFTPNRTPAWLAGVLRRLPYRVPGVGMYTLAIGHHPDG